MKLEDLKKLMENCKEDYYENDKKDNFHILRIVYRDENDEEGMIPPSIAGTENLYIVKDDRNIYWIRTTRSEFEKMLECIEDEDIDFTYEEGNNGYADYYHLTLVSVTDNYVYFEITGRHE